MGTLRTWFGEQQPGCGAGKGGCGLLEGEIGRRGEGLSRGGGEKDPKGLGGEDGEPIPAVRCGSPDRSGGKKRDQVRAGRSAVRTFAVLARGVGGFLGSSCEDRPGMGGTEPPVPCGGGPGPPRPPGGAVTPAVPRRMLRAGSAGPGAAAAERRRWVRGYGAGRGEHGAGLEEGVGTGWGWGGVRVAVPLPQPLGPSARARERPGLRCPTWGGEVVEFGVGGGRAGSSNPRLCARSWAGSGALGPFRGAGTAWLAAKSRAAPRPLRQPV